MYSFIDIDESYGKDTLPSEALKINGQYIEDLIPGYRTLNVSGRELSENEITDLQVGISDGSNYVRKRYRSRTITVRYSLITKSNEEFRQAYNTLNAVLDQEEAQLIFNDEPEFYFVGTKSGGDDIEPGRNSGIGTIEFYCANPFKYSTQEHEISPIEIDGQLTFFVDYKGTYKTFPSISVKFSEDDGYLGFINQNGVTLQFGSADEADGEDYKENETQTNLSTFTAAQDDTGENYMHPEYVMSGSLKAAIVNNRTCLTLGSTERAVTLQKWNGGMRTIELPADSEGDYGAKNFYCYLNSWFETGLMGQTGEQSVAFLTADNEEICGYSIGKTDMNGNTAKFEMRANHKAVRTIEFTPSVQDNQNPWNENRGHYDIRKIGNQITFYWFGSYYPFTIPEIENMECYKIQVSMSQYSDRGLGDKYVTRNYLREVKFQKMYVEKWKNIPNKFMSGDTFTVDCDSGTVLHNNLSEQSLGTIGNDWENFYLVPGENKIKCLYSEWVKKQPNFLLRYKEVYI